MQCPILADPRPPTFLAQVMAVCKILDGILPTESVRGAPPPDKKLLEYHFVFACVWAFGGCMLVDKVYDYRTQFSKWWCSEWKNVPFPEKVRRAHFGRLRLLSVL